MKFVGILLVFVATFGGLFIAAGVEHGMGVVMVMLHALPVKPPLF